MANLANIHVIRQLLQKHSFHFSKSLGQNFLVDTQVCPNMAASCGAGKEDAVLEIGPGIGVLTRELAKVAGKVLAIELDKRLLPVLAETLQSHENVQILHGDILKANLPALFEEHFSGCHSIYVCANLPYYITSPVIMHLLESHLPLRRITVMVQKEAAERLCALPGTRKCGAVSIGVHYRCTPNILFEVPRTAFYPPPNVDSAVIQLTLLEEPPVQVNDERFFFQLVKAAFSQRRKTAANAVSSTLGIQKSRFEAALHTLQLNASIRAEMLTMEAFAALSNILESEAKIE